jgi:hypothetical protein
MTSIGSTINPNSYNSNQNSSNGIPISPSGNPNSYSGNQNSSSGIKISPTGNSSNGINFKVNLLKTYTSKTNDLNNLYTKLKGIVTGYQSELNYYINNFKDAISSASGTVSNTTSSSNPYDLSSYSTVYTNVQNLLNQNEITTINPLNEGIASITSSIDSIKQIVPKNSKEEKSFINIYSQYQLILEKLNNLLFGQVNFINSYPARFIDVFYRNILKVYVNQVQKNILNINITSPNTTNTNSQTTYYNQLLTYKAKLNNILKYIENLTSPSNGYIISHKNGLSEPSQVYINNILNEMTTEIQLVQNSINVYLQQSKNQVSASLKGQVGVLKGNLKELLQKLLQSIQAISAANQSTQLQSIINELRQTIKKNINNPNESGKQLVQLESIETSTQDAYKLIQEQLLLIINKIQNALKTIGSNNSIQDQQVTNQNQLGSNVNNQTQQLQKGQQPEQINNQLGSNVNNQTQQLQKGQQPEQINNQLGSNVNNQTQQLQKGQQPEQINNQLGSNVTNQTQLGQPSTTTSSTPVSKTLSNVGNIALLNNGTRGQIIENQIINGKEQVKLALPNGSQENFLQSQINTEYPIEVNRLYSYKASGSQKPMTVKVIGLGVGKKDNTAYIIPQKGTTFPGGKQEIAVKKANLILLQPQKI